MSDTSFIGSALAGPISPSALWAWQGQSDGSPAKILGYPPGGESQPTKTGLMPNDLQNFVGIPLQFYGRPIIPVPVLTQLGWIRQAEDWVERETGVLLCQSWVAAPPALAPGSANAAGVITHNGAQQVQGVDYDVGEPAYDFWFQRAEDAGWMALQLRYRPVKSLQYSQTDFNALKRWSYMYPLLNEFFRIPPQWFVTDEDMGYIRAVPSTDIQLLPLFALYLGFLSFTDSLPGGMWMQYTAGLTPADYTTRYSFIPQLVLAQAAITALSIVQGTINIGFDETSVRVDGLDLRSKFNPRGAYAGLIDTFTKMRDNLLKTALSKVSGPMMAWL